MKVIIAGSRNISNYKFCEGLIDDSIDRLRKEVGSISGIEIVSGGAKGVDKIGEQYAQVNEIDYTVFPADWNKHGKAAGIHRNREMAEYADAAILIWDGFSPGTKHMRDMMMIKGKPFELIMWNELDGRKI